MTNINQESPRINGDIKKDIEEKPLEAPVAKDELEERKKKTIKFLKQKKDWIVYLILALIVYISVYIRTRNISKLKDITTGTWTLGPDLDPFLFLRWAKYIVANGSLMAHDAMRYVPLGYNTAGEMKLLAYMIAWFHNFLTMLGGSNSVTYSAILFPAVMFALTSIAFFLFTRKIFYKESKELRNVIALIATAFFVLIPSLLPRTIAGIPEKESAAFFFMFMTFYLFLEAFTSEKLKRGLIFSVLAGISTALMALVWGGVIYIFFIIPSSVLIAFLLGKIDKNKFLIYSSWIISSFIFMMPFSSRYALKNLIVSLSTGFGISILFILGVGILMVRSKKIEGISKKLKLPQEIFSFIFSFLILMILALMFLGSGFLYEQVMEFKDSLVVPVTDRFGMTVAENRQPYFKGEWEGEFGPMFSGIPLFFWMFILGSVALFNYLIKNLEKKEKIILTITYFVFLICLIFSRYSSSSILNGVSGTSLFMYFGGWLLFLGSFVYIYCKRYKKNKQDVFKEFNFSYILYFMVFALGLIGARGGIRLIMVLGAVSPVAAAFLVAKTSQSYIKEKRETLKLFIGIIALILIIASIFTIWTYYKSDKYTAGSYAPGVYQWQWQKAMQWVRENTSQGAVFAHWWDYGYWLQSIGERATILDGGNALGYWNHLLGRHVLTGSDERIALEFLYAHNGTHLLIDSTEIGKYTAFSSIGSDENYDRFSWISTFLMDERQTQETQNETVYVYTGGISTDEDIVWQENGKEIFLPRKNAGIGAIILKKSQAGQILQPQAIFVYNGQQYVIPLRYAYFNRELHDFGSGLDAGIFLFPSLNTLQDGRLNMNEIGAMFYLSRRTIHSHLANLYLFDKKSDYFKLAHTESNLFIENLRQQGVDPGEFVYYQGFQGPIKIWEVNYPKDIKLNPDFLETNYPNKELTIAKRGEY